MVVDDDVRLRDLLRRYLTEQGFNVFTAESATAMNKLWLRERYDLLVLDLMLPGEDGLSICRRLRAANDVTPIIMLTAKVEEWTHRGLEMGADDYLPKHVQSGEWWPASAPCCAARAPMKSRAHRRKRRKPSSSATSCWTWARVP